jgi:transcriptional regulator with XRE-family HTH domain
MLLLDCDEDNAQTRRMSSATNAVFAHHSWQNKRNARTLRAYMALHNQEIAERLRELRGSRPQVVVASAIQASPRALQNWEAGIARPSWRNVEKLAEYYDVAEEFILTGGRRSLSRAPEGESERPAPEEPTIAERLDRIEACARARSVRASADHDATRAANGAARTRWKRLRGMPRRCRQTRRERR